MTQKQMTNVVYAMLPCREDFDMSMDMMRSFGEVGGVNVVENGHGLLEVAYYDVRSAEKAMKELGHVQCWEAAPCGNRVVNLPGWMGLDKAVVDKIYDMHADKACPDTYVLEFFDIRDAHEYREIAQRKAEKREERLNWEAADSAIQQEVPELEPGTFAVLVSGVPNELLTKPIVAAMLEQAFLQHDVLDFTLHTGLETGNIVLRISSDLGLQRCLYHFGGCTWGCSATFLSAGPALDASAAYADISEADLENFDFGTGAFGSWDFQQQVVDSGTTLQDITNTKEPTSDASTDLSGLSESDEDEHAKHAARCKEEPMRVELCA